MNAYLREGWKKEVGCEAWAERMDALLVNIDVPIYNIFQGMNGSVSWKSIALMVATGADRVQLCLKIRFWNMWWVLLGSIELQSTINKRNKLCCQWSKRFPIFWKAIWRQAKELPNAYKVTNLWGQGCQSKTTAQSGLMEACSKVNTFTTWTVCLHVFLITCIPDESCFKQWVERLGKALSSIDI